MEKKILVVDDEAPIRCILEKALSKAGFTVLGAANAEEGLEVLRRENVPVMFLDLMLPGMDGKELCRQIRQNNPVALLFAVTGHSSLFELTDCREAGFDDYFTKPFSLKVMIQTARNAFARIERWRRR